MRPAVFRIDKKDADPINGKVIWAPAKSLWINSCLLLFLVSAPFATTPSAIILFLISTYTTLLIGHSVGAHRKLIHRSYCCSKFTERFLVYLGVLVGMAGPFGLIKIHDIRDWAQREPKCHDFFSHRSSFWKDALLQLNCTFKFKNPPKLKFEREVEADTFYVFLERTWILQQLPIAYIFYLVGGWSWVVWGVFGRVFVSVFGHWTVTYLTHNPGPGKWLIPDAGVQASNLTGFGFITMGECWHNNHHAFPESSRIGLEKSEFDPGWIVLKTMEKFGLVWSLGLPRNKADQGDLRIAT